MTELAVKLGTDPDRLRLALEDCQRMGYLERLLAVCEADRCGGCSVAGACSPTSAADGGGRAAIGPTWWRCQAGDWPGADGAETRSSRLTSAHDDRRAGVFDQWPRRHQCSSARKRKPPSTSKWGTNLVRA